MCAARGSVSYRFLSVVVTSIILERVELSHGVRSGMVSIRLQPPESFDFKRPDEWPRWKKTVPTVPKCFDARRRSRRPTG